MEWHRSFLAREANADSVPLGAVASLLRSFRWTPESSRCWRRARQAVTGPLEGLGPSHHARNSAPGNNPPPPGRSRSSERQGSPGWTLPAILPYVVDLQGLYSWQSKDTTGPAVEGQSSPCGARPARRPGWEAGRAAPRLGSHCSACPACTTSARTAVPGATSPPTRRHPTPRAAAAQAFGWRGNPSTRSSRTGPTRSLRRLFNGLIMPTLRLPCLWAFCECIITNLTAPCPAS